MLQLELACNWVLLQLRELFAYVLERLFLMLQ